MINKPQSHVERCPSCRTCPLERIGSDYYCPQCQQPQVVLEDEVRMVPSKYESNSKGHRQLENDRRLNVLIREFTSKYRELSADEERLFRQRLASVKGETPRKKGTREAAAVVVFVGLGGEVKLTIREFCKDNVLSVRLFNQKYKVYQKLFRPQADQQDDDEEDLKQEEKLEESSPTEKSEAPSAASPALEGTRHALSIIFDSVFTKFVFRARRKAITESLVQRLQRVDGELLRRIRYSENVPLKMYYLIFAVLKNLRHKINYLEFSKIIKEKTGYLMKRKASCEVRKHYEAFLKERAVKEELQDAKDDLEDADGGQGGEAEGESENVELLQ